ncbi:hypothetical protein Tcan_00227, partial [Toxocara canis]
MNTNSQMFGAQIFFPVSGSESLSLDNFLHGLLLQEADASIAVTNMDRNIVRILEGFTQNTSKFDQYFPKVNCLFGIHTSKGHRINIKSLSDASLWPGLQYMSSILIKIIQ